MIHTPFLFVLGLVAAGCSPEALADSTSTRNQVDPISEAEAKPATQKRVVIPVEGMACESCAERLQHRLAKIDGVSSATVDFAKKEARVTFDPKRVSVKKIVEEIDRTFEAGNPERRTRRDRVLPTAPRLWSRGLPAGNSGARGCLRGGDHQEARRFDRADCDQTNLQSCCVRYKSLRIQPASTAPASSARLRTFG